MDLCCCCHADWLVGPVDKWGRWGFVPTKAKKENIWTADANSDVSDSQLNDSNDSDETQIVYK